MKNCDVAGCCSPWHICAAIAEATAEVTESKVAAVVEKKGKARDKELVGSIPKVRLGSFSSPCGAYSDVRSDLSFFGGWEAKVCLNWKADV